MDWPYSCTSSQPVFKELLDIIQNLKRTILLNFIINNTVFTSNGVLVGNCSCAGGNLGVAVGVDMLVADDEPLVVPFVEEDLAVLDVNTLVGVLTVV